MRVIIWNSLDLTEESFQPLRPESGGLCRMATHGPNAKQKWGKNGKRKRKKTTLPMAIFHSFMLACVEWQHMVPMPNKNGGKTAKRKRKKATLPMAIFHSFILLGHLF